MRWFVALIGIAFSARAGLATTGPDPASTPTIHANRIDMVRTLIAMEAKVNDVDELSMTPLMHAALVDFGDTAVVELLLASGAETKATSKDGLTALDFARRQGHQAAARLLAHSSPGN
jgi:ankyrin repeat protein